MLKQSHVRYINCLTDMYTSSKTKGYFKNMLSMAKKYGVSSNIGSILQKLKYVVKARGFNDKIIYKWAGGYPDLHIVSKVIEGVNKTSSAYKGTQKNPLISELKKRKTTENISISNSDKVKFLDKAMDGVEVAEKYGVPKEQRRRFVKDFYFKK